MRTSTCPAAGLGVGTSSSFKTSGPPNCRTRMAFMIFSEEPSAVSLCSFQKAEKLKKLEMIFGADGGTFLFDQPRRTAPGRRLPIVFPFHGRNPRRQRQAQILRQREKIRL